ncbi:hypothetical protein VSDG_02987 [Cytospora chrysosperma]|uniref:Uncharacterized protein n=1 Tax=Cytospora chrysosperma TaxID=252740 RepID=A0A423W8Y9_CYTCH|nr:hypothetical protein VSDG_02987 [Valsa sordida]
MDQSLGPPVEDNCDVPRQSIEQQDIPIEIPNKKRSRTTRGRKRYIRGKGPRAQIDNSHKTGDMADVEESSTNMSHQETCHEDMETNNRVSMSPAWGYSAQVDATPTFYEDQAADGSLYQLLAGMIQRKDEMSREAIGLIRTQVEDLRDARIESLNERTRTANEYKEQLKHQREDFNRARTEDVNRWRSYLLQEQKALRESSQDRWGTLVVGLILAFLVWVLNKVL